MKKAVFSTTISTLKRHFQLSITTTVCILLLSLSVYSLADAQSQGRTPVVKTADEIVYDLKSRLNLTSEQETQIRPIFEEQVQKRNAIMEKYQGQGRQGWGSMRNEMQELRNSTDNQLRSILTKEQMDNYQKAQDEERQKMRKGSRSRKSGESNN